MIVLVGFMGAGKSTIGEALAQELGVPFADTDRIIESAAGRDIPAIFSNQGEATFRALESETVAHALAGDDPKVVALGGGALDDGTTVSLLASHTVVFLDVALDEAMQRIEASTRPMLVSHDPSVLYRGRAEGYRSVADVVVDTTNKRPHDIVDEIVRLVRTRRVEVATTTRAYPVLVGSDILTSTASLAPAHPGAERVGLITHPELQRMAQIVAESYERAGLVTRIVEVPAGESSKSLGSAAFLYERMVDAGLHRRDMVVGVGGGVVTDLAGFVGSTFMRGIDTVLVATTLLGQVDAAIGGKTGVNLDSGKNLVGTISQPAAVICDVTTLRDLPEAELRSGLAEVAKYGFIADPVLAENLMTSVDDVLDRDPMVLMDLVQACAQIKADVVGRDERESFNSDPVSNSALPATQDVLGREVLNYGHTFGHAIEAVSAYEGIRHGEAVSLGMMIAANLAELTGLAAPGLVDFHEQTLVAAGLPVSADLDGDALEEAWQRDKKYSSGARFVLLRSLGDPVTGVRAERKDVMEAIKRIDA